MTERYHAAAVLSENLARTPRAMQVSSRTRAQLATFNALATFLLDCRTSCRRIYITSNGGSTTDTQHIALGFVSHLASDSSPLPAEALCIDGIPLTEMEKGFLPRRDEGELPQFITAPRRYSAKTLIS
jgi:phosphoheptose isomerase